MTLKLPTRDELQREIKYLLSDGTFACSLRLNRLRQLLTALDLLAECDILLRDIQQRGLVGENNVAIRGFMKRLRELGVEW
jgi:hypothetical protein